jgi:aspartate/methionine/tyrosine aminotransferase
LAALPELTEDTLNPEISDSIIQAAMDALDAGKTHYTDRPGILKLRKWVSDQLKSRFDIEISPDEVTITCGATEARFVTITQLAKPDTQIYQQDMMPEIEAIANLIGAESIREVIDPATVSLAYLRREAGEVLWQQAIENDWWVIWEMNVDADGDRFHPAQLDLLAPKVVTIGTFSKYMPGWRVGWMAGSEMASNLRAYKQSMTICTTSISQWAVLGMLE